MRKFIFTAAALLAVASPAFADPRWTAMPVHPSSETGLLAGTVLWNCAASGCASTSDTTGADSLTACRDVARHLGTLSAFSGREAFSADRLAKCNKSAGSAPAN